MNIAFSIFKIKPHGTFSIIKYLNTANYRKCLKYLVDTNVYANENAKNARNICKKVQILTESRGEHINMPGIDTIIGGSCGAAVQIVSERNGRD